MHLMLYRKDKAAFLDIMYCAAERASAYSAARDKGRQEALRFLQLLGKQNQKRARQKINW